MLTYTSCEELSSTAACSRKSIFPSLFCGYPWTRPLPLPLPFHSLSTLFPLPPFPLSFPPFFSLPFLPLPSPPFPALPRPSPPFPSYYTSWTLVASTCSGKNQSTACINPPTVAKLSGKAIAVKISLPTFDCWPKCARRGIFDWFLLSLCGPPWTLQACFYQSKTVDSCWPINVLRVHCTTCMVWQCSTF